jgi:hypothetical protein
MRRTRRKAESAKPEQFPTNTPKAEANGNVTPPNVQKMQVSEQEASLTAKNYRLAKELSELRQKYKEVERKSTKLSMENVSLACFSLFRISLFH